MVNLIEYAGNNRKNNAVATVGTVSYTLPAGVGTMESAETYKVASVPANCLITSVAAIITDAFDSATTAVIDVGTTESGEELIADLDGKTAGVTTSETDVVVATDALTSIYVTPTLTGATTKGTIKVVVNFTELEGYDGKFTE
jgi:hypothetical protein